MACEVIVSMTSYRSRTQNKPADRIFYSALLDNILLPALKNLKPAFKDIKATRIAKAFGSGTKVLYCPTLDPILTGR
jgi:hypothetical protein